MSETKLMMSICRDLPLIICWRPEYCYDVWRLMQVKISLNLKPFHSVGSEAKKRQLRIALRNSGHVLSIIAIQFTIPDPLFSMSPLQNDNASTRSEANSKWRLFLLGNAEQSATFAGNEKTFLGRNCELPEKRQLFSMQER